MYLLIDTKHTKFIARCADYRLLDEHALHQGLDEYIIGDQENMATFDALTQQQCEDLAERYGMKITVPATYTGARQWALDLASKHTKVIDVPKRPRPTREDKAPSDDKVPALPGTAPKRGVTKRVWEIADEVAAKESDDKALRAAVIAACEKEGINKSTAGTQFAKWRKARG